MWIYEITTGNMYRADGTLLATGYSGGYGGGDAAVDKNNPAAECIVEKGPLPEGMWSIGPLFDDAEMQCKFVMRLTPDFDFDADGDVDAADKAAMKGRTRVGFLIHGDSIKNPGNASKGCIILPRVARIEIGNSGDMRLKVVATCS